MQTFGQNLFFLRFSLEVCIFGLLERLTVAVYDDCSILNESVQIHRNADGQGNEADGHRDCQFDDHEE